MSEQDKIEVSVSGDWEDQRKVEWRAVEVLGLPDDKDNISFDTPQKLADACRLIPVTFSEDVALLYRSDPGYKPSRLYRNFIILKRDEGGVYRADGTLTFFENAKLISFGKRENGGLDIFGEGLV